MPPKRRASEMTGNSETVEPGPVQMIKEARIWKEMAIEEYFQSNREARKIILENESKIEELREHIERLEKLNLNHEL